MIAPAEGRTAYLFNSGGDIDILKRSAVAESVCRDPGNPIRDINTAKVRASFKRGSPNLGQAGRKGDFRKPQSLEDISPDLIDRQPVMRLGNNDMVLIGFPEPRLSAPGKQTLCNIVRNILPYHFFQISYGA